MKIIEDFEFDKKYSDKSTGEYLQRGTYFMYNFDSYWKDGKLVKMFIRGLDKTNPDRRDEDFIRIRKAIARHKRNLYPELVKPKVKKDIEYIEVIHYGYNGLAVSTLPVNGKVSTHGQKFGGMTAIVKNDEVNDLYNEYDSLRSQLKELESKIFRVGNKVEWLKK